MTYLKYKIDGIFYVLLVQVAFVLEIQRLEVKSEPFIVIFGGREIHGHYELTELDLARVVSVKSIKKPVYVIFCPLLGWQEGFSQLKRKEIPEGVRLHLSLISPYVWD